MTTDNLVEKFSIETDAPVYIPGSVIRGHVCLQTNKSVLCQGVTIEAIGEARCCLDSKQTTNTTVHKAYRHAKTLFGGTYQTDKGEWLTDEIRFGTGIAPEGGRLQVPLSKRDKKFQLQLIGCSRGEDYVLGSTHLYPHSLIDNCKSKNRLEIPLTSDGTTVTATVHFSASWLLTSTGDCHVVRIGDGDLLRVVTFDIFSVSPKHLPHSSRPIDSYYCKLIPESMKSENNDALITIPSIDMKLPFTFTLPEELPTYLDTDQGSSIRYYLKCALEGNAELPIAVCHFGVIQPIPASIPALATARTAQSQRRSWSFCSCGPSIRMMTQLDRSGYAPGEIMRIKLKGVNTLKVPLEIRIDLVRTHRIKTARKEFEFLTEFSLCPSHSVEMKKPFELDLAIPFPCVAPTYEGIGEDGNPLTWDYQLVVHVEARQRVVLTHCATIVAAALPTEIFPESKGDLIKDSRIEKAVLCSKETRAYLGNWREVVGKEGIGTLKFAPEPLTAPIRALNKFVRAGNIVEVPFVPSYSSTKALPINCRND